MSPEDRSSWQECKSILDHIREDVKEIKEQMKALNGTVRLHDKELAVLKDWRCSQGDAAVKGVQDLKVELAKFGVFGGGMGFMVGVVALAAKVFGVL